MFTFAALLLAAASNGAPCHGADPVIASVTSRLAGDNGMLNRYAVHVVVTNRGQRRQPPNDLQSVDIIENGQKVGEKGVPPLAPGQSYAFDHVYQRSSEAEDGSTHFTFRLVQDENGDACATTDNEFRLRV